MLGMKAKVKNINYKKGVFLKPYYKYSSTNQHSAKKSATKYTSTILKLIVLAF